MIRLFKLAIDPDLARKIAETIAEHQLLEAQGKEIPKSLAERYKQPAVKARLCSETRYKCAYCESRILHIDYGDVEHMQPKTLGPWQRYAYENLTISCGICNTNKHENTDVLNPYADLISKEVQPTQEVAHSMSHP